MKFYLELIAILILDVVTALSARQAFEADSNFFLLLAMISLAMAGVFFIRSLERRMAVIVNALWIALGSINIAVASYFVFGETLTLRQFIGMAIIIMGVICLEVFSAEEEKAVVEEVID